MKRSQMLEKMCNVDFEWWSIEDADDFKRLMNATLDIIETSGMLPPDVEIKRSFYEPELLLNEWEPENG